MGAVISRDRNPKTREVDLEASMSILGDSIGRVRIEDQNIESALPKYVAMRGELSPRLPISDDLRTNAQSIGLNRLDRVTTNENTHERRCEIYSSNANLMLLPTSKRLSQPQRQEAYYSPLHFRRQFPKRDAQLHLSPWQTSNSPSHGRYLRQSSAFCNDPSPQSEAQKFLDSLPPTHLLSPTNTPSALPLRSSRPLLAVPIASATSLNDVHVLRFSLFGLTYETLLSALSRLFACQITSVLGSASRWELRYANIESVKFTSRSTLFDETPETVVVGHRNVCDAVRKVGESRGELKLIVEIEDVRMKKGWIIKKDKLK